MHVDSDEEVDGRRVTAICYLNAHWRPGDGGEVHARRSPALTCTLDSKVQRR